MSPSALVISALGKQKSIILVFAALTVLVVGNGCSQSAGTPTGSSLKVEKSPDDASGTTTQSPETANDKKAATGSSGSKNVTKTITEDLAREKLKIALDSWAFGDSDEKLKKDHPEIKFLSQTRLVSPTLAKYSITTSRQFEIGYQFLVSLSLKPIFDDSPKEDQRLYEVSYDKANKIVILERNPSFFSK